MDKETAIKDYVLMMLGAPIVKIELKDEQLEACVKTSIRWIEDYKKRGQKTPTESRIDQLTQEMSLAMAMTMLGHVRGKYSGTPREDVELDGKYMRKQGWKQMQQVDEDARKAFLFDREEYMNVLYTLLQNKNIDPCDAPGIAAEIMKQIS